PANELHCGKSCVSSSALAKSRASARIDLFFRLRRTWLPANCRFIRPATDFSYRKHPESRIFSSRRKTLERRCMATVWLRAYRAMNLTGESKDGGRDA